MRQLSFEAPQQPPELEHDTKEVLVMLGLALAHRGYQEEAQCFYEALEHLVPQTDLLLWLQASHDWMAGRTREAVRKLEYCDLPEAQVLMQMLHGEFVETR